MLQTFLFFLKAEKRHFLNEKLINIVLANIFYMIIKFNLIFLLIQNFLNSYV